MDTFVPPFFVGGAAVDFSESESSDEEESLLEDEVEDLGGEALEGLCEVFFIVEADFD